MKSCVAMVANHVRTFSRKGIKGMEGIKGTKGIRYVLKNLEEKASASGMNTSGVTFERVWRDVGGNQNDIMSRDECGGYKTRVNERIETRENRR